MTTTDATETTPGAAAEGTTATRARGSRARTTTPAPTTPAPTTPTPQPAPSTPAGAGEERPPALDLNLPFLRLQLRAPEVHLPHVPMPHISGRDVGHAVDVARTFLPPPERVLYYGGLGALAAIGILEWPVAAAIGAGTLIAQRATAREQRWSPLGTPQKEGRGTTTPTPGTPTTGGRTPAQEATAQEATAQATERETAGRTTARGETKTTAAGATRRARAGAK